MLTRNVQSLHQRWKKLQLSSKKHHIFLYKKIYSYFIHRIRLALWFQMMFSRIIWLMFKLYIIIGSLRIICKLKYLKATLKNCGNILLPRNFIQRRNPFKFYLHHICELLSSWWLNYLFYKKTQLYHMMVCVWTVRMSFTQFRNERDQISRRNNCMHLFCKAEEWFWNFHFMPVLPWRRKNVYNNA